MNLQILRDILDLHFGDHRVMSVPRIVQKESIQLLVAIHQMARDFDLVELYPKEQIEQPLI